MLATQTHSSTRIDARGMQRSQVLHLLAQQLESCKRGTPVDVTVRGPECLGDVALWAIYLGATLSSLQLGYMACTVRLRNGPAEGSFDRVALGRHGSVGVWLESDCPHALLAALSLANCALPRLGDVTLYLSGAAVRHLTGALAEPTGHRAAAMTFTSRGGDLVASARDCLDEGVHHPRMAGLRSLDVAWDDIRDRFAESTFGTEL